MELALPVQGQATETVGVVEMAMATATAGPAQRAPQLHRLPLAPPGTHGPAQPPPQLMRQLQHGLFQTARPQLVRAQHGIHGLALLQDLLPLLQQVHQRHGEHGATTMLRIQSRHTRVLRHELREV